jgi:hypothetical protein
MHFLVSESFYGNTAPPKKEIDWTYVRDKMQGLRNPQENLQKAHILQKYKNNKFNVAFCKSIHGYEHNWYGFDAVRNIIIRNFKSMQKNLQTHISSYLLICILQFLALWLNYCLDGWLQNRISIYNV